MSFNQPRRRAFSSLAQTFTVMALCASLALVVTLLVLP
jgi:hypothetical protein